MREIRFRAWHKLRNQMCPVASMGWWASPSHGIDNTRGHVFLITDSKNGYGANYPLKEIELMQFTGLKDKNGKEIYEGDILAWEEHKHLFATYDDSYTAKRVVKWHEAELKYGVGHLSLSAKREFEVIGNIYENPNLLKEEASGTD